MNKEHGPSRYVFPFLYYMNESWGGLRERPPPLAVSPLFLMHLIEPKWFFFLSFCIILWLIFCLRAQVFCGCVDNVQVYTDFNLEYVKKNNHILIAIKNVKYIKRRYTKEYKSFCAMCAENSTAQKKGYVY